jgi:glutamate carboxypeptidase
VGLAALEDLERAVEAALPAYLRDVQRLVDVDSGSYSKSGVDEVGAWMARRLEELGASVVRHANRDLGDTIVGTFEGDTPGRSVLMIGHLDTVFEPGTVSRRPFTIRGRRAYGPGVSDMKGGLLVGLHALAALRAVGAVRGPGSGPVPRVGWLPVGRLVFIANPDEEIGSPVSTPIILEHAEHADVALVLEPGRPNGDVVSSRKGRMELRLQVHGRSAHAGVEPQSGRNAVLEAAHRIIALQALNDRMPGVTVNVGVIHGGTRPNVVAEQASMEIDVRAGSRSDLESVEAAIMAMATTSTVADVSSTVELLSRHWPMERTTVSERLVRHAVEAAAALGSELHDAATGGASDGNTTSGVGVPTLDGLGPVGGQAHSPDEYIELDSIVPRTTLLARLLQVIGHDALLAARGAGGETSWHSRVKPSQAR